MSGELVLSGPRHCLVHVGSVSIEMPGLVSLFPLTGSAALRLEFPIRCHTCCESVGAR